MTRSRAASRAAAALTSLVAALWAFGGLAPAPAAADDDPAAEAPVTIVVDAVSPAVLHPGEDLTVTATVHNNQSEAMSGASVGLRINRVRPASRAELEGWVTGSSGAVGKQVVAQQPEPIPAGGAAQVTLTVPANKVGLLDQLDVWGPRGLAVTVADTTGTRLAMQRTFLLWQPDEAVPQVRVAVVAAVTGPGRVVEPGEADDDGSGASSTPTTTAGATTASDATGTAGTSSAPTTSADRTALEALTSTGGRLHTLLTLAADPALDLVVDPALLADAAAAGPSARAWATGLGQALAVRESFALPWSDPDLVALARAGDDTLLGTARDLTRTAWPTSGTPRQGVLWSPDASTGGVEAALAAATEGVRAVVVGTSTLQADGAVADARQEVTTDSGTVAALVPDDLLTRLMTDPESVEPGASVATTVQRMLAEIAVLAHDGAADPHEALIAIDRTADVDPEVFTALMAALRTSPWSRLVPLSATLGAAAGAEPVTLPDESSADDVLSAPSVRALAGERASTIAFAQVTADPEAFVTGLDDEVLAPLAVAWRADPAARGDEVAGVLAGARDRRTGLSLVPVDTLTVISSSAPFRFVVRNDLGTAATVRVEVRPRAACLRPSTSEPVEVPAGEQATAAVELQARANCDVVVDVLLVDEAGLVVGEPMQVDARVAPTVENVGTIVVAVLLAIGLVLGIARTVRRGRSARRGARLISDEEAVPLPVLGGEPALPREGDEATDPGEDDEPAEASADDEPADRASEAAP